MTNPIHDWHACINTRNLAGIAVLVAEGAALHSPAAPDPVVGGELVAKYLQTALSVLVNDAFHYTAEWHSERSAVLEFEGELEGVKFNGVDIIHWDAHGLIDDFKVMVRPILSIAPVLQRLGQAMKALQV